MINNKKILTITISTLLGVNYASLLSAMDYETIVGGTTTLTSADKVFYDKPNDTSNVTGVSLSSASDSLTVNGATTITVNGGGYAVGVSAVNGAHLDLGSGTTISNSGGTAQVYALNLDGASTDVTATDLTINSTTSGGYSIGINASNGVSAHLKGVTTINATNTQAGTGYAVGLYLDTGSALEIDKLALKSDALSGGAVRVYGGSSLTLGDDSTVTASGGDALLASGAGSKVNMNKATIIANNGAGINAQSGAKIDLGSETKVEVKGGTSVGLNASGISTQTGEKSQVTADHLTLNYNGTSWAAMTENQGSMDIGEGSHIISSSAGIGAGSASTVNFKGTASERNTVEVHSSYGFLANTNSVVNIENTDLTADNVNGSGNLIGMYATNRGVINAKNTSIDIANGGAAVYSMNGSTVNLSGKTQISAGSNSESALGTQGTNSKINVTDQAVIKGNIFASGAGSSINLDLTQGSIFTGYSTIDTQVPGATIDLKMADGIWNVTGDSQVNQLVLNNSTVNFSNTGYKTLTADSLDGTNGLFNIRTDMVGHQGDLIVVNGIAQGDYKINVANDGSTSTNGTETLTIVKTNDNQANFSLANKVELGAYEYGLRSVAGSPNDLELYSSGGVNPTPTTTALAATSFLNIGYLTNYIENQTLLQRLGDLRNNEISGVKSDGFWMKGFGGKLNSFSGTALDKFDMTYTGTQLGIDKQINVQNGSLLIGAVAGFTRTNPNYRKGDGNGKNYTAGLYATYLLDDGLYVDTVLKYNNMRNHFNVEDTQGATVKGTGKTHGISLSAEVGKRFWISNNRHGFYVEPQAQLSYGYQSGDTIHSSNGLKVGLSHYNSTLGRISGIVGYQTQGVNPISVYLKTGVVREMSGGATYRFNDANKNGHSFRSSWFDNGIGANININKRHNIYAEADYSTGNHFDNAMLNVGYRYSF